MLKKLLSNLVKEWRIIVILNCLIISPTMKNKFLSFFLLFFIFGCVQIEDVKAPCTVTLSDGTVLELSEEVRFNTATRTITYRDASGNLRSIFQEDYVSTTCKNQ
jgi:hypothetical protein